MKVQSHTVAVCLPMVTPTGVAMVAGLYFDDCIHCIFTQPQPHCKHLKIINVSLEAIHILHYDRQLMFMFGHCSLLYPSLTYFGVLTIKASSRCYISHFCITVPTTLTLKQLVTHKHFLMQQGYCNLEYIHKHGCLFCIMVW